MSHTPRPTVRSFVVCERVVVEQTGRKRVSLLNLLTVIRPAPGEDFPLLQPELSVFAQLTECRGVGRMRVEIRNADTDAVIRQSPDQPVAATNDPLVVRGAYFRFRDSVFPEPGLYQIQLIYDDAVLAEVPVVLRTRTLPPARGETNGR